MRLETSGRVDFLKENASSQWFYLSLCLVVFFFIAVSFFQFSIREFYYDSANLIFLGQKSRANSFLITVGPLGGNGVYNPPLFINILGALGFVTHDPQILSILFSLINFSSICYAIFLFYRYLPRGYALASAIVLVSSPSILHYVNIMWSGALVIPLSIVFFGTLLGFVTEKNDRSIIVLTAAAAVISQCHQSGFYLYPIIALVCLVYFRSVRLVTYIWSAAVAILVSFPYIIYLFFQGGLQDILSFSKGDDPLSPFLLLLVNVAMNSSYYYHYVFRGDFLAQVTRMFFGFQGLGLFVYILASVLSLCFMVSWGRYLAFVLRRGRLWSTRPNDLQILPLPFQLSGCIVTIVTVLYLFSLKYIWFKHLLIVHPAYAILTAWPLWQLWRKLPGKVAIVAILLANSIFLGAFFFHVHLNHGYRGLGAINDYGLTYSTLRTIRNEIWEKVPPGHEPALYVSGYWERSLVAAVFDKQFFNVLPKHAIGVTVFQDTVSKKYVWKIVDIEEPLTRHAKAMEAVSKLVATRVNGCVLQQRKDENIHVRSRFMQESISSGMDDALDKVLPGHFTRLSPRQFTSGQQGWEVVIIDTGNPLDRSLPVIGPLLGLLADPAYSLEVELDGIYVFRLGKTRKEAGHETITRVFPVPELFEFALTGTLAQQEKPQQGWTRKVSPADPPGYAMFGPYLTLPQGEYSIVFSLKKNKMEQAEAQKLPIVLDVAAEQGQRVLNRLELDPATHLEDNNWQQEQVDFTIRAKEGKKVEFRVYSPGNVAFEIATPKLICRP